MSIEAIQMAFSVVFVLAIILINVALFLKGCMILTGRSSLPSGYYTMERIKREIVFIGVLLIVLVSLGIVAVSTMGLYAPIVVAVAWISLIGVGARLQIFRPTPGGKKGYFFYSRKELKRELKVPAEVKRVFTPGIIIFILGLLPGIVMGWHPFLTILVGVLFYFGVCGLALLFFFFWSAGKIGETMAKGARIVEEEYERRRRRKKE